MTITLDLASLRHTELLGIFIGRNARPGDVFFLRGDLGAGKTTLTQFIGQGLGVPASCYITSPTFSLLHEYPGRLPLYHFDLYRLGDEEEIMELGFGDILSGDGLSVVEWPDRLGIYTPADRFEITLTMTSAEQRRARITALGRARDGMERFSSLSLPAV